MKNLLLYFSFLPVLVSAQATTTSVQDGDWDDPATWDCNCVPEVDNAVVIHDVRIDGNTFLMQLVHVMPVGRLWMDQPFNVAIMDTVINDGLMDVKGDIDVDWALLNNATIVIEGVIHNDAVIVMGGPNALLATDHIGNYDTIEGEGSICVAEYSENTGTIHGLIDFCDGTPTVGAPPYIDVNTGTVAGSVTFCSQGSCGPQTVHTAGNSASLVGPNPANDHLRFELPERATITMRDARGRVVLSKGMAQQRAPLLDVSALPVGLYSVTIGTEAGQEVRRVAVAR